MVPERDYIFTLFPQKPEKFLIEVTDALNQHHAPETEVKNKTAKETEAEAEKRRKRLSLN